MTYSQIILDHLGFTILAENLSEYSHTEALTAIEEVRSSTSEEEFTEEEYKQAIEAVELYTKRRN